MEPVDSSVSPSGEPSVGLEGDENVALNKVAVLKHRGGEDREETTFYIVGTAHISKNSCDKVAEVVRAVKPDVRGISNVEMV